MRTEADVVVIGIGNADRGDDAAGREVAKLLAQMKEALVVEAAGGATELLEIWRGAHACVIIDAVSSGEQAGFIHRLPVKAEPLPTAYSRCSSHGFGLAEAIELARALDDLPPEFIVYGIETGTLAIGAPLSPAVREAIPIAAERVRIEVQNLQRHGKGSKLDEPRERRGGLTRPLRR